MICRLQTLVNGNQLDVVQNLETHVSNTAEQLDVHMDSSDLVRRKHCRQQALHS